MHVLINNHRIGTGCPVYFVADLAANHNGDLALAKELVHACAESRVDAIKMQNFTAETIVSDYGFRHLGAVQTHQSGWSESVFDSYKAASIPLDWTQELKELCDKLGLDYFTSPYSPELVRTVSEHVAALKLGSGDITWHEEIGAMAQCGLPLFVATGASTMAEVEKAMDVILTHTDQIVLMQCNTNYTAKRNEDLESTLERFRHINLRVLDTYARRWPDVVLGLSDHTHGSLTVLAAVGLFGCCAVEKHFTLDSSQAGQDHAFSMMPDEWKGMVEETEALLVGLDGVEAFEQRLAIVSDSVDHPERLDLVLGDGIKRVEKNEENTIVVQRRSIRARTDLRRGTVLGRDHLIPLRPCPKDGLPPYRIEELLGRRITRAIPAGDIIRLSDLHE